MVFPVLFLVARVCLMLAVWYISFTMANFLPLQQNYSLDFFLSSIWSISSSALSFCKMTYSFDRVWLSLVNIISFRTFLSNFLNHLWFFRILDLPPDNLSFLYCIPPINWGINLKVKIPTRKKNLYVVLSIVRSEWRYNGTRWIK